MSTLQISLAIAGGLVLAGVVAHGTWNSRRNAPRQAVPEDAAGPKPHATHGDEPEPLRTEPTFDGELEPLPQTPVPEKKPGMDALIDVIAPIALDAPVSGDAALAAMPSTRRAGSKPFAIEGLNETTGQWELPAPGQRYGALQAGVQLANRTGALNEIEY
ncbi:MAG: cell division protein FtsZ, partial [Rhodoferax sp.]